MKKDFVFTIEDGDAIDDLENEKSGELNPDFKFGDFEKDSPEETWDMGGAETREDELEVILKRHGAFKEKKESSKTGSRNNEGSDDDEHSESESQNEEQEEAESDSESDPGNTDDASEGKNDGEAEDADDKEAKILENDFFDKAKQATASSFTKMSLSRPVQKGIGSLGYTNPTPIQGSVIPVALLGKDIVAGAATGSGKTAAFMVPILERLVYRPQKISSTRVVILTPTRELAMQIHDVGSKLGKYISNLRFGLAVGGLNLRVQEQELKTRPDIVVATPGRFIDHVRNSPSFSVDSVEILVIDEADRMLEEGFESELNEILTLIPSKRQTMLFSATMNNSIKDLIKLSLHKPAKIMIDPPKQAASGLTQEFVRIRQHEQSRPAILVSLVRNLSHKQRVIVFVTRKKTAHHLRVICGLLGIRVGELHGSLSQEQRLDNIAAFKRLELPVLICTDLASRGLDIPKIEVVINYELPDSYDVYLHRVGRTARAGRSGTSISLVGETTSERSVVKAAIQAANGEKNTKTQRQKILGRDVDWNEIKTITQKIDSMKETIEEVLAEEKTAKEITMAERDITRAQNLVKHKNEIQSRPKRTWFEEDKKDSARKTKIPKTNHQKKKAEAGEQQWGYKKTKGDRAVAAKRGGNRAIFKAGAKAAKTH